MARSFNAGDHVTWNSEAGGVGGWTTRKIASAITFKGYKRHATPDEPQYLIKSDRTDHVAIHTGSALCKTRARSKKK